MNLLFSCIGKRGYIADYFRPVLRRGDRIIGTGDTPWTPGFSSCDESVVLPGIYENGYIDAVFDVCRRYRIHGVLSFNDNDVSMLSRHQESFEGMGIVLMLPSAEACDIAFDKYRTFTFLKENGILTPQTALSIEEGMEFGFPLIIKPRRGSGSHNVFIAKSVKQLQVLLEMFPDMIIQKYVQGQEFDIELCGDLEGRTVGYSCWIKHQSRLGETERAETFRDSEVFDLGMRLGELMRVRGPMDIDLIRRDGKIYVLEFNPRFGGGYPVSQLAGADFPALLVEILRTGSVKPRFNYRAGIFMIKRLNILGGPIDSLLNNELKVTNDEPKITAFHAKSLFDNGSEGD